jgi:hypothetical protein
MNYSVSKLIGPIDIPTQREFDERVLGCQAGFCSMSGLNLPAEGHTRSRRAPRQLSQSPGDSQGSVAAGNDARATDLLWFADCGINTSKQLHPNTRLQPTASAFRELLTTKHSQKGTTPRRM